MAARKYPWEQWFGQEQTMLVHGIDYDCSQSTMVQTIRNNASARGVRVRVKDRGWFVTLEVLGEVRHTDRVAVAD